jgi:hypothetical protein
VRQQWSSLLLLAEASRHGGSSGLTPIPPMRYPKMTFIAIFLNK